MIEENKCACCGKITDDLIVNDIDKDDNSILFCEKCDREDNIAYKNQIIYGDS